MFYGRCFTICSFEKFGTNEFLNFQLKRNFDIKLAVHTLGVNFINILRSTFFVYESVLQSFSIVTIWICNFWRKNICKLHFGFVTFWEKDISAKAACKNVDEIDYR
jgi:hypothetical protein